MLSVCGASSDRSEKVPRFSLAWYIKLDLSRARAAWHRASGALLPETLMRLLMFSKWSLQTALVPLGVSWSQALLCGSWVVLACKAVLICSVLPPFPGLSWVGESICVTTWPVLTRGVIHGKQKQVRTKQVFREIISPISFTKRLHRYFRQHRLSEEEGSRDDRCCASKGSR